MAVGGPFEFDRFRFDPRTGELWCNQIESRLTPRAAAVLSTLAGRAQQVVTKQELFDQIWGGLVVGDDALTSCIQELRQALGDDARKPRYIETRHRRGYRLMVPITPVGAAPRPTASHAERPAGLVGRLAEMGQLDQRFGFAVAGQRQVVFVTGEPGIGKSALASAFVGLLDRTAVKVTQGQCLDHHGVGEPYLPLIEALTRLGAAADGGGVRTVLATHAPSWLAQMPSLWTRADRVSMRARGQATRERMLRELTLAVEALAADMPLVLVLEDIHWSDASTLDWLVHVARRPEPARIMVLATYRPADPAAISVGLTSITAELALHGRCHELALSPLDLPAVEAYLADRLKSADGSAQPRDLARPLLERTGGNPLFMVSLVNQLVRQPAAAATPGAIVAIPQDVRRFIDRQIDDLSDADRDLLTAASVIRREFASAAVAAAMDASIEVVEAACARLARQGVFIVKAGSGLWPDGTPVELYAFRHDLYREMLYDRLTATRRAQMHSLVGRRLEAAWTGRLDAVAAEVAEHFERGYDRARAIPHHQRAAAQALRRSANQEAINHLQRALDAVGLIADERDRTKTEVELRVRMGAAYIAMHGFGAPVVLETYERAEALCDRLGERADVFPALWGQWMFRSGRSEMPAARRLCARLLALAERFGNDDLKIQAHHASWATSFVGGELSKARGHAQAALALFDAERHQPLASSYGNHDAGCCARNFSAMVLALVGDEGDARTTIDEALAKARRLDDPFSLALTLFFSSAAAQMFGDAALATQNSALSVTMATEHGLAQPKAWSMGVAGWCIAANGEPERGVAMAEQAVAAMQAMQSRHFLAYLLGLLADAQIKAGRRADAMQAVEQGIAMAHATGEHFYSAELHRLRGELLAQTVGRSHEAGLAFQTAIGIAIEQGARTLERRARDSLRQLG